MAYRFPQLPVDAIDSLAFFWQLPWNLHRKPDPGARQPFSIILKHNGTISVLSRKFVTDLFFVVCAELRLIGENSACWLDMQMDISLLYVTYIYNVYIHVYIYSIYIIIYMCVCMCNENNTCIDRPKQWSSDQATPIALRQLTWNFQNGFGNEGNYSVVGKLCLDPHLDHLVGNMDTTIAAIAP